MADILPLLPSPLPADVQISLDAAVAEGNFAVVRRADGAVVVVWRDAEGQRMGVEISSDAEIRYCAPR